MIKIHKNNYNAENPFSVESKICIWHSILFFVMLTLSFTQFIHAQIETVPVANPVYDFLKRMEVRGLIGSYSDAILPLSRTEVANYINQIRSKDNELSGVERALANEYSIEFGYELSGSLKNSYSLIPSNESDSLFSLLPLFGEEEKYLYNYADSNATFFVDGILNIDARRSTGQVLGGANAEFYQFGGRVRGTILNHLGYYIQETNAAFYGSRDVLKRDKFISQSYELSVTDTKNFDFMEGYARYNAGIVSLQIGQERLLWGNGYGDKMVLSDYPREFPFIRFDVKYKAITYTMIHAWLLGTPSTLKFTLPSDTTSIFEEPVNADKYFAGHRIGFSFPNLFDIGAQEMVIYSNRPPDLALMNPFSVLESAQRSRGERDNTFWAFNIKTKFIPKVQLQGTILFDDINFPVLFSNVWTDRWAVQSGLMITDPAGIPNTNMIVEYTKVEPYVFSHGRSRDDNYSSNGVLLGDQIGPNSDSWFLRIDQNPTWRLRLSLSGEFQRKGENIVDPSGHLLENVGGDFLQPHRDGIDSDTKNWLGGEQVQTLRLRGSATYEIVHQFFIDVWYRYERQHDLFLHTIGVNHDFGIELRIDL